MKRSFFSAVCILMIQFLFAQYHSNCTDSCEVRLKEYPILWQQKAAEYRALCYQSFNLAALRLNEIVKAKIKKPAIITDLDETILNNSYQQAELIKRNEDYSSGSWK